MVYLFKLAVSTLTFKKKDSTSLESWKLTTKYASL